MAGGHRVVNGLILATASYWSYRPEMGVPVVTSIGRNRDFDFAPHVNSLKPWETFRKMDDRPVEEQASAYRAALYRRQRRVWADLADLRDSYPRVTLVLLCWCSTSTALDGGCHRRWAADWFATTARLNLPEMLPS